MKCKIYPSSSAFIIGGLVHTSDQNGCLRNVLLSAHGIREDSIAEVNVRVGAMHESYYARTIPDDVFGSEVPVKGECDGVPYSGRCDFLTKFKSDGVVHETKGTVSYNTYKKVIKDGQPKHNNLSQLVFYMSHFNTPYGKLIYGYYKDLGHMFEQKEQRIYKVTINQAGDILLDGSHSGFMVQDHMAHRMGAAHVLKTGDVWERPEGTESGEGACKYCIHKETCLDWDKGIITDKEEFINEAKRRHQEKAQLESVP